MKFADPYALKPQKPRAIFLFAASELQGMRSHQEDFFVNYNDECFALADGVGSMPHGEVAARLACETATWAYRHVGARPYYWSEKEKLLKRIFRSTNLRVWQKRRDPGFEEGLATTLMVTIVSPKKFWLGYVGDSSAYLFRDGLIDELTSTKKTEISEFDRIGMKRLGLIPNIVREPFLPNDCLLLATNGVASFLDEEEMRVALESSGTTSQSVSNAVMHILETAKANGSTDNMTACIIKYILPPQ